MGERVRRDRRVQHSEISRRKAVGEALQGDSAVRRGVQRRDHPRQASRVAFDGVEQFEASLLRVRSVWAEHERVGRVHLLA